MSICNVVRIAYYCQGLCKLASTTYVQRVTFTHRTVRGFKHLRRGFIMDSAPGIAAVCASVFGAERCMISGQTTFGDKIWSSVALVGFPVFRMSQP